MKQATVTHRIKRGLNIPISGAARQAVETGPPVSKVALVAADYHGMRPRMRVQAGDKVKRGEPLFEDRRAPGILYTSPGAGTVNAVHRGRRRALLSVVIDLDEAGTADEVTYDGYSQQPPEKFTAEQLRQLLLSSGLWTAFRTRPFDKVPRPDSAPDVIFVTAMDTHPLAPDPLRVLKDKEAHWKAGLIALRRLIPNGRLLVGVGPGFDITPPDIDGIEFHEFKGRHPAGTAGLALHTIFPVNRKRSAWHVGYQDTAAIGHLVTTGRLSLDRVVSLAGPGVHRPQLLKTRIGAPTDTLVSNRTGGEGHRVISGSVLNGREVSGATEGYLGRYHNQITVLKEANDRRFLGWLGPGLRRFSVLPLFASKLLPTSPLEFSTDSYGSERVMVPIGLYEKVWPFDLLVTPLLRALLSKDIDTAESLGCLELSEEDMALCSFVCPSKIDYGQALRETLNRIEEEG